MAGVVLWLWKSVQSDKVPDLQAFASGLAGVGGAVAAAIVALGIAQRQRGDAGASKPSPLSSGWGPRFWPPVAAGTWGAADAHYSRQYAALKASYEAASGHPEGTGSQDHRG